jgi:hypothetical protein
MFSFQRSTAAKPGRLNASAEAAKASRVIIVPIRFIVSPIRRRRGKSCMDIESARARA